jgi:hypothetical protein
LYACMYVQEKKHSSHHGVHLFMQRHNTNARNIHYRVCMMRDGGIHQEKPREKISRCIKAKL